MCSPGSPRGCPDEERFEVEAAAEELLAAAQHSAWDFERRLKLLIAGIKARTRPHDDVEEAERQRAASTVKRWTDKASGMKHTMISLDPLRDEQLHKVIDAKLAELRQDPANAKVPFEQLKVMAVMAAVSAEAGAMGVAEVVIHIDATHALSGPARGHDVRNRRRQPGPGARRCTATAAKPRSPP